MHRHARLQENAQRLLRSIIRGYAQRALRSIVGRTRKNNLFHLQGNAQVLVYLRAR